MCVKEREKKKGNATGKTEGEQVLSHSSKKNLRGTLTSSNRSVDHKSEATQRARVIVNEAHTLERENPPTQPSTYSPTIHKTSTRKLRFAGFSGCRAPRSEKHVLGARRSWREMEANRGGHARATVMDLHNSGSASWHRKSHP